MSVGKIRRGEGREEGVEFQTVKFLDSFLICSTL